SVCVEARAQLTQTVVIQGTPTRREGREPIGIKPNVINYADCLADDKITFKLNALTGSSNITLEVWVGTSGADCGNVNRSPATIPSQCWQVYIATPWPTASFDIPVREILPHNASGPGTSSPDVCDTVANDGTGNGNPVMYFVPVAGQAVSGGTGATYNIVYDLKGPTPPTNFNVGLGDTRLIASWTTSGDRDITGYKLFCEATDLCASEVLVPDTVPPTTLPDNVKSSTPGPNSTEGDVSGLENGQEYVCSIAGTDAYGNVGKLSGIACGTPKSVDSYYKVYRAAGGEAGGGYCSFSRSANMAFPPFVLAAGLAFVARRKRRRSIA
ncbi:MAG TPA: hypothetical protein VFQ35_00655, partial [Polyangiaceae bacterium]|nr:hypothetical protein [Polyangiaceae bacterium]